jgi:hypothetical protein
MLNEEKYYYERILSTTTDLNARDRIIKKMNHITLDNKTQIYIVPNFGMGDLILMIGGIRYYATLYDTVIVICPTDKLINIKLLLRDDINIRVEDSLNLKEQLQNDFFGNEYLLCAYHKSYKYYGYSGIININDVTIIPECYYQDLKLDPKIRMEYFYFRPTVESELLYNLVKDTKYIFIHNIASDSTYDMTFLNNKKTEYLLINCSMNMYDKEEYYYELAERFINRYIIHYSKVIENATELHLLDSGLNAFAQQLDLSRILVKKIYIRGAFEYKSLIQPDCERIYLRK